MRTLLIRPVTPRVYGIGGQRAFPLGLGYIAAVLEKSHKVEVLDMMAEGMSCIDLVRILLGKSPDVVGITSDTLTFQAAIEVAETVKLARRDTVVVIGGTHSNVWPDYPLRYSCFDISAHGEGEATAVELWSRLEAGESYSDVRGIAFRGHSKVITNPKREPISNLDELPFPARHLFPMNKYNGEYAPIGTSRGCPFACSFCSNNVVWGRSHRFRSADNVIGEIKAMKTEYGISKLYFREDIFTANKKRVIDLCEGIIAEGLDVNWECESRVGTVDREVLAKMKEAGCKLTWFGVESGSPRMLEVLNKQITVQQVAETYRLCREVGIPAGASFIIGTPGETRSDVKETVSLAKRINPE